MCEVDALLLELTMSARALVLRALAIRHVLRGTDEPNRMVRAVADDLATRQEPAHVLVAVEHAVLDLEIRRAAVSVAARRREHARQVVGMNVRAPVDVAAVLVARVVAEHLAKLELERHAPAADVPMPIPDLACDSRETETLRGVGQREA